MNMGAVIGDDSGVQQPWRIPESSRNQSIPGAAVVGVDTRVTDAPAPAQNQASGGWGGVPGGGGHHPKSFAPWRRGTHPLRPLRLRCRPWA
jgi:hypothetical protein